MAEYPFCPHNVRLGNVTLPQGGWNGGVSRCSCCFGVFGYINSGSFGNNGGKSRTWTPSDRCGSCGGSYHEHSWGDQATAVGEGEAR